MHSIRSAVVWTTAVLAGYERFARPGRFDSPGIVRFASGHTLA
jgi:hypothetical protein